MSEPTKVTAVRGAVQADGNSPEAILSATEELLRELISRNDLGSDAMVSAIFTTTADLDAEFPATAPERWPHPTWPSWLRTSRPTRPGPRWSRRSAAPPVR